MKTETKILIALSLFCISMAALEGAVVVYLRALYYPNGFTVALKLIDQHILLVEIVRELATLVMLCGVAYIVGKTFKQRFAYFLISFAIWDIFYYVWLKVFIDWPSSLFDWDILFLIPITWLAPVIAPILCSLLMIAFAMVILRKKNENNFHPVIQYCLVVGCVFVLAAFMQDYVGILLSTHSFSSYPRLMENKAFVDVASNYLPRTFNWQVFGLGMSLICFCIYAIYKPVTTLYLKKVRDV